MLQLFDPEGPNHFMDWLKSGKEALIRIIIFLRFSADAGAIMQTVLPPERSVTSD
jgi:hypothetical protein